ncbi:type II secretion system F family protein [Cellulomonas sp. URHB0016]
MGCDSASEVVAQVVTRAVTLWLVLAASSYGAFLPWWLTGVGGRGQRVRGDHRGPAGTTGSDPGSRQAPPVRVDVVLVLELVGSAVATGVALPRALGAVGSAVGGTLGEELAHVAAALVLGASWSTAWAGRSGELRLVADALQPAWTSGSAPGPALRACAEAVRRDRRGRVREAAGSLGVRLVLPLGVCFLPAFVLLGIVPVVLSLARGLVL